MAADQSLWVSVKNLERAPVSRDVACTPDDLDLPHETDSDFRETVTGRLDYRLVHPRVEVKGRVATRVHQVCGRCLAPMSSSVQGTVDVLYEHNEDLLKPEVVVYGTEGLNIFYFDGDVVRPGEQVREALLLEVPPFPVCSPQCKGLCPVCGEDLNAGPCGCADDGSADPDWKRKLRGLKVEE